MSKTVFEFIPDTELELAEVSVTDDDSIIRPQSVPLSKLERHPIQKVCSDESIAEYLKSLNLEDHPPTSNFYAKRQHRATLYASPVSPLFNSQQTPSPELMSIFADKPEVTEEVGLQIEEENVPQIGK